MGSSRGMVGRSGVWICVYGVLSFTMFNDALCRRSKLPTRRRGGLLLGHDTRP